MKIATLVAWAALWTAPFACAQKLDLKFNALAAKASTKAEIDLDGALLKLAIHAASGQDASGLLSGVQAVHIRTYEFENSGAYSQKDLDALHGQVTSQSRWSKVLNIKEDDSTTEIFIAAAGDQVSGILILSAEERELSVIYLEGSMTLGQMRRIMNGRHELAELFGDH
jgi:hypothetical protein